MRDSKRGSTLTYGGVVDELATIPALALGIAATVCLTLLLLAYLCMRAVAWWRGKDGLQLLPTHEPSGSKRSRRAEAAVFDDEGPLTPEDDLYADPDRYYAETRRGSRGAARAAAEAAGRRRAADKASSRGSSSRGGGTSGGTGASGASTRRGSEQAAPRGAAGKPMAASLDEVLMTGDHWERRRARASAAFEEMQQGEGDDPQALVAPWDSISNVVPQSAVTITGPPITSSGRRLPTAGNQVRDTL